jgi:glutamate synthase domain-containing protein 3
MSNLVRHTAELDVQNIYYRDVNACLREMVTAGSDKIILYNVHGQRYIGTGLDKPVEIEILGTPGNDLGAFMNGSRLIVRGNAQDGCGNTMNAGEIVIHGHAGDTAGLAARGGKIFIRDGVGYRTGIHMKEYQGQKPVIVIGGTAQDFTGEYMAGGVMIILGLNLAKGESHRSKYIGTGMHGGGIYLRGSIPRWQTGKEVDIAPLDENDKTVLAQYVNEFAGHFNLNATEILGGEFIKLYPRWLRPYGRLYAY